MLRNTLQKRLRFESLEEKVALAADLSVQVINGDLVITGDANPNSFLLEFADDEGQYRIRNRGPLGDTINGDTNQILYVNGVTRDVIINLGGGDDVVRLYGFPQIDNGRDLNLPRDLIINAGAGNDQIYIGINEDFIFGTTISGPVNIGRDLTINGGAGDEIVWTTDISVGDDLTLVDTSGSIDFQNYDSSVFLDGDRSYVAGDVSITTGAGNDLAGVVDMVIGGNVMMSLGGGDDYGAVFVAEVGGSVAMSLGAGNNIAQVESAVIGGGLGVIAGGSNIVSILGVEADLVTVLTANGDDFVLLASVDTCVGIIATFGGADRVEIVDSAFDLLTVELGAGDDALALSGVDVRLLSILSGGRGVDGFEDLGGNQLGLLLDLGFETYS